MGVNQDFCDLFRELNEFGVRYLVVGAYATIYYTEPRYTKDIDIWVEPVPKNARRLWTALTSFGAPLKNVKIKDFTSEELVYQIGIAPNRIDIMMGVPGLKFSNAWKNKVRTKYGGQRIFILSRKDLIKAKRVAGRSQDKLDIERLTGK